MHSTEIAAVFLVAMGVIAVRFSVGVFALIWGGIRPPALRAHHLPKRTAPGPREFVKNDGVDYWQSCTLNAASTIRVVAADVNGNPNPELLDRVTRILADLTALELIARAEVYALTDKHILDEITDGESADFVLGFSFDDQESGWGETVYVYFKDGEVAHWDSVD